MPKNTRRMNYAIVLFGRRVKHFRKAHGLTLKELVERSGVNYVSLIDIEHGRTTPTLVTAFKLAEALDFEFDDLKDSV
jgi:transcriptional regulator with XRE-family HTH domain